MGDKIGIIYSPGYGAGWSTWGCAEMATDQELAIAIDNNEPYEKVLEIATRNWPEQYMGGLEDCQVEWVEEGTQFRIEEYDGSESLEFNHETYWNFA